MDFGDVLWRTFGAQNHGICAKTIKNYKKYMSKNGLFMRFVAI